MVLKSKRGPVLSPSSHVPYGHTMPLVHTMTQIDLCIFSQPFPHFCIPSSVNGVSSHVVYKHFLIIPTILFYLKSTYYCGILLHNISEIYTLPLPSLRTSSSFFLENCKHFLTGLSAFCLSSHLSISQTAAIVIFLYCKADYVIPLA